MKLAWLATLALFPLITLAQKQTAAAYQLNGEVNFPKGDETGRKIYFVYQQNGKQKIDSALIANNKFSFSGIADISVKTSLQFTKPFATPEPALDPNTLALYLNNGLVDVKASGFLSRAQVTGSPVQDEYTAFTQKYSRLDRTITGANRRKRSLAKNDSLKLKAISKTIDSAQNAKMNELCLFLNQDIAKPYAVQALLMYLRANGSSLDVNKAENYFKRLPENQQRSVDGQDIEKLMADIRKRK